MLGSVRTRVEASATLPGEWLIASPLFCLFARGRAEELEPAECVAAVGRGEASEHRAYEPWVEDLLCGAEALAGSREPDVPHTRIGLGAISHHVALPDEAVDGDGHGGDGYSHVGGQLR